MKAFVITNETLKTGVIQEIEGDIAGNSTSILMTRSRGELNRYYAQGTFPADETARDMYDGIWYATETEAKAAAVRLRKDVVARLVKEAAAMRKVKFTIEHAKT